MLSLDKADLKNKKVLVRVDFNVMPFTPREPRIINSLETIRFLMRKKERVILITHLETNEGKIPSALKLAKWMRERYFRKLIFFSDFIFDKKERKNMTVETLAKAQLMRDSDERRQMPH